MEQVDHDELIRQLRGVQRIVINRAHGGFGLSNEAVIMYLDLAGIDYTLKPQVDRDSQNRWGDRIMVNGKEFHAHDNIARDDPALVATVRRLGSKANGTHARLKIVEVPAGVTWEINEYDGKEWVAEVHRTWQ
jgi:hypothetical protein